MKRTTLRSALLAVGMPVMTLTCGHAAAQSVAYAFTGIARDGALAGQTVTGYLTFDPSRFASYITDVDYEEGYTDGGEYIQISPLQRCRHQFPGIVE